MAEEGFDGIEEGLTQTGGETVRPALDNAAQRVALPMAAATARSMSADPPASCSTAPTVTGWISFFATTPAATRPVVSLPEKTPPPR